MTQKVHRVLFISDIHFGNEDQAAVATVTEFIADVNPALVVVGGDICDLESLSRYTSESDTDPFAINGIRKAVASINVWSSLCRVYLIAGNHDERWERAVYGKNAIALRGAKGLSFREQMVAQGLSPDVRWVDEDKTSVGLFVGKRALLCRHGHKQGRFSPHHVAHKLLEEVPTVSTVVGHHHRAQMYCRTSLGRTVFAIANPHLSENQNYTGGNPNWQKGFTLFEFFGRSRLRDCDQFTPYVIVFDRGRFSYGGKVYGEARP